MGCLNSTITAVQTLTVNEDEDDTGSKLSGRGDSAVSKGTADSGVVMENRGDIPGAVPRTLPPLTSESIRENVLLRDNEITERQNSHKILEELLNQGIIPKEQHREKSSRVGEAYSIMLDDNEGARRRPPARLESLKMKKAQILHTREELEEKIQLAEERRKLKEDKLKMRLRTKSARVRVPATISSTEKDEDASITPVETLAAPHPSQVMREAAEGGEWMDGDDNRGCEEEVKKAGKRERREEGGDHRGEAAEREVESSEKEEEEEMTQVEEFTASGELECDSSFQHADDKEEVF
ncbi:transcription regulator BACH [Sarotherodon galilaeus]